MSSQTDMYRKRVKSVPAALKSTTSSRGKVLRDLRNKSLSLTTIQRKHDATRRYLYNLMSEARQAGITIPARAKEYKKRARRK